MWLWVPDKGDLCPAFQKNLEGCEAPGRENLCGAWWAEECLPPNLHILSPESVNMWPCKAKRTLQLDEVKDFEMESISLEYPGGCNITTRSSLGGGRWTESAKETRLSYTSGSEEGGKLQESRSAGGLRKVAKESKWILPLELPRGASAGDSSIWVGLLTSRTVR